MWTRVQDKFHIIVIVIRSDLPNVITLFCDINRWGDYAECLMIDVLTDSQQASLLTEQ
jgi:hypothetical protein